jgi:hypothetical protein
MKTKQNTKAKNKKTKTKQNKAKTKLLIRCSGRVGNTCSTSGTCRVTRDLFPLINHEKRKDMTKQKTKKQRQNKTKQKPNC